MQILKIKNWEEFQQYKDREPKWIKLHRSLLRDYKFGKLSDTDKAHLLMIWLLAAETGNEVPNDAEWIKNHGQLKSKPDIEQFVTLGFLVPVQDCTQPYIEAVHRDREETEKRRDRIMYPSYMEEWIAYRKEIKKPLAKPTIEANLKKLKLWEDAGHNPYEIVQTSIANGWQGLFEPKSERINGKSDDSFWAGVDV